MAGLDDDPEGSGGGADEDEPLPTFKRDAGSMLSADERAISDRARASAEQGPKGGAPSDTQRGGQHCSHGSHGSHGSW